MNSAQFRMSSSDWPKRRSPDLNLIEMKGQVSENPPVTEFKLFRKVLQSISDTFDERHCCQLRPSYDSGSIFTFRKNGTII